MAFGEDELFEALAFGKEAGMEDGHTYVVKERKPRKALDTFKKLLADGYHGLYVTRQHPDHLGQRKEGTVRLIWLSTTLGKDYMDPHNLSSLSALVREFVETHGQVAILLDGLEYLMINNDFQRILNFIELLIELVAHNQAVLIVSVDDRAFEERELALLERSTTVFE